MTDCGDAACPAAFTGVRAPPAELRSKRRGKSSQSGKADGRHGNRDAAALCARGVPARLLADL